MQDMHHPREDDHGVALVGKHIVVVGGYCRGVTRKVEAFDTIKDAWKDLPDFDEFGEGVTLVSANTRYVIAFGGKNQNGKYTDRIVRLDFYKLNKGWKTLSLANQSPLSGYC
jgi:hypothetical protein